MFYGLHTTRKSERDNLLATKKYKDIVISPFDFHKSDLHKPIVVEEGSGRVYQHTITDFLECLKDIDKKNFIPERTNYFYTWQYKGDEPLTRLKRLPDLYNSIKEYGIKEPVECECTGERLNGSFRTKIALYLGISEVKAREYRFDWRDISDDFILRKLTARKYSSPKDYYQFSFGYKDWVNIPACGHTYTENASERWDVLKDIVKGKTVLDLGCNEGYMALQLARQGKKVVGIDHDWIHLANLNRLVYEYIDKKDLDVEFIQGDILNTDKKADTVLMLCLLYHIARDKQVEFLKKFKGSTLIFQCNLRKIDVRNSYYTSHPDDLIKLLTDNGFKIKEKIDWRDKPIIIAK